jgi:uncharacterized protein (TIGR02466 family)
MSNINVHQVNNNVTHVFPVGLYAATNLLTDKENAVISSKVHELRKVFKKGNTESWLSGASSPDNCFHLTDLTEYLEFTTLINKVTECVNDFARHYGSDEVYECTESWYNVYQSGKYQEFHMHPYNIFSAIYYVKVPKGAAGTYFKRPDMGSMLPPKNKVQPTPLNQDVLIAPPQEKAVVIFRSNLQHSVPPSTFDGERITIALNFA